MIDINKISLLISAIALLSSIGISSWIYTVMKARIDFLKEDIERFKASENKWMVKYRKIVQLILDNKECAPGVSCKTREKYIRIIDEEGLL